MNHQKYILLPFILLFFYSIFAQEICNNAIDDDGDGLIDYNDIADCFCTTQNVNTPQSLISNPSFEDYTCVPYSISEMDCAIDWLQCSSPTPDYLHTDGLYIYNWNTPLPLPDGDGYVGFFNNWGWQEYFGTCLNSPILQDTVYTFQFSVGFAGVQSNYYGGYGSDVDSITIVLYGSSDCNEIEFGGYPGVSVDDCPSNYPEWEEIASIYLEGDNEWVDTSLSFTALDTYNALIVGGTCLQDPGFSYGFDFSYHFFDNLIVNTSNSFQIIGQQVDSTKIDCNYYSLSIANTSNDDVQWYKNGIALIGENANQLVVQNNIAGNYFAVTSNTIGCALSDNVTLTNDQIPQIFVVGNNNYDFPINTSQQLEVFTDVTNYQVNWSNSANLSCLNCPNPNYNAITDENLTVEITDLGNQCKNSMDLFIEVFEIDTATFAGSNNNNNGGSGQNSENPLGDNNGNNLFNNCLINIPNVFTPNGDGNNDVFNIVVGSCYEKIIQFSIYDRFGENVRNESYTEVTKQKLSWDGTFKNKILSTDVFYYVIQLENKKETIESYRGNVTLLR